MNILNFSTIIAPYGELKNTPTNPLINGNNLPGMKTAQELFNGMDSIGENLKTLVDNINTFNDYFWHPSHLLKSLWILLDANALNIFLFIALTGFLAYSMGYKKGSKITIGSMAGYFMIKCLSKVI